ncbi:hypothetical protein [Azospirillum sp. sgz302134]
MPAISLPGELWGVAAYFNPAGAPVMRDNLALFGRRVRDQGLKLLIVELAFADAPFTLPDDCADLLVRRRSGAVLWQKERLLNIGVESLPPSCDKVVWLDADILFENDGWVGETARLLESFSVVQPYDTACWLPRGTRTLPQDLPFGLGEGQCLPGMAAALAGCADRRRALADYFMHGHTGFAWAARRAILDRHGLYDRSVLGGGDVAIAHAIYGDNDFWRGLNPYCRQLTRPMVASIAEWSRRFHEDVQGRVHHTPGRVLHLWHGSIAGRKYVDRAAILKDNAYDPATDVALDVTLDGGGCLRWASDKPDLHERVRGYFALRASDTAA